MDKNEIRLKTLEKQNRQYREAIEKLEARIKALLFCINAVYIPIVAKDRTLLTVAIKNLKTYEQNARKLNEHDDVLEQFRAYREMLIVHAKALRIYDDTPEAPDEPEHPK